MRVGDTHGLPNPFNYLCRWWTKRLVSICFRFYPNLTSIEALSIILFPPKILSIVNKLHLKNAETWHNVYFSCPGRDSNPQILRSLDCGHGNLTCVCVCGGGGRERERSLLWCTVCACVHFCQINKNIYLNRPQRVM